MPSGTPDQVTEYVYGVTIAGGSDITHNGLLATVKYPDRVVGTPSANASDQCSFTYNAWGQIKTSTDQNGSVHAYIYDILGTMTDDTVTLASGNPQSVDTSVKRIALAYDTARRPFTLTSYAANGTTVVNQLQREYNGLGQLTKEYQSHSGPVNPATTPSVQYSYSVMVYGGSAANHSRLTSTTYPDGRQVHFLYADSDATPGLSNAISRISAIASASTRGTSDANVIAGYTYLGLGTVVRKDLPGPALRLDRWGGTTGTYAGLDQFDRIIDQQWVSTATGGGNVFDITHGYDRNSNRTYAKNTTQGSASHVYTYDNLNRLSDDKKGQINANNTDISSFWVNGPKSWSLDLLGNPTAEAANTAASYVQNTVNCQNQITQRKVLGNNLSQAIYAQDLGTASDWQKPGGAGDAFDVTGWLHITGVSADTFSGQTEGESRTLLLRGEPIGPPNQLGAYVVFPTGATSGQAGFVFGYKSPNDYWMYVADLDQHVYMYHVVNGAKTQISAASAGVSAGTSIWLAFNADRYSSNQPWFTHLADGFPSGKVGLVCNHINNLDSTRPVSFFAFYCEVATPRVDIGGRWESDLSSINSSGRLPLWNTGGRRSAVLLKNLRLQKFQATFAVRTDAIRFLFDAKEDGEDCDWVQVVHCNGGWPGTAYAVGGHGLNSSFNYGDMGVDPNIPSLDPADVLWTRVQSDGTQIKVWFVRKTEAQGAPSDADWVGRRVESSADDELPVEPRWRTARLCRPFGGQYQHH